MIFDSRQPCPHLLLAGLIVLLPLAAQAETPGSGRYPVIVGGATQDIAWTDNQDGFVCPSRPVWSVTVQGTSLLLKTRNFDYQAVPIALRGDGSASMDRIIQPGRNVKYRVSGTFDGKGRLRLRLEDLTREREPCSWRFEAEYRDGIVPGVKAGRSGSP